MTNFVPSKYQTGIFEWISTGRDTHRNALVQAVPGSGKTTTILKLVPYIPQDFNYLFCAFNKHIEQAIKQKLYGSTTRRVPGNNSVSTIHALGFRLIREALGKANVQDKEKKNQISSEVAKLIGGRIDQQLPLQKRIEIQDELLTDFTDFLRWTKENLVDFMDSSEIKAMCSFYGRHCQEELLRPLTYGELMSSLEVGLTRFLEGSNQLLFKTLCSWATERDGIEPKTPKELEEYLVEYRQDLVQQLKEQVLAQNLFDYAISRTDSIARQTKIVTFDDMTYLPWLWNLEPRHRFDVVLVDEAQDLSRLKRWIVKAHGKPNGHYLFVGDRFQSIYSFAGADASSMNNIQTEFACIELPLSVCYRCPKSHVRLLKLINPEVEASENAPEGEIHRISSREIGKFVRPGALILSRKVAPLTPLLINLIKDGIDAVIRGDSIAGLLKSYSKSVGKVEKFSMDEFGIHLSEWASKRVRRFKGAAKQDFLDVVDALSFVYGQSGAETLDDLLDEIDMVFNRKETDYSVVLSSIHKAKGGESQVVFVLDSDSLPLTWEGQLTHEFQQEENCKYVALSRSREFLYLCND